MKGLSKYPVAVIKYTCISSSEVNTQPPSPSAKKKYPVVTVLIVKFLDLFSEKKAK